MPIVTAPYGPQVAYVARFWRADLHGPFRLELLETATADGPAVEARVNAGRWIADCPTPRCASAMYVDPDDRRWFCVLCVNAPWDGRWLPVVWPDDRDRVEAALLDRPVPATRHWDPGETAAQVRAQNAAEGVG